MVTAGRSGGDSAAAEALYRRHAGRVAGFLLRSGFARPDADDLTQETFLRAMRSLRTFDADKGSLGLDLLALYCRAMKCGEPEISVRDELVCVEFVVAKGGGDA